MQRPESEPTGVLVVDKPPGLTSHDVVARVRRALSVRRVGHAGTLDPMATGVLVVMVGEATKLAPFLTRDDKRYRGSVQLGIATTTLDAEGEICERQPLPDWWRDDRQAEHRIARALAAERARREQTPPAFSAIKIAGRAAHARARAGEQLELAPRAVEVRSLELMGRDVERGVIDLELCVSKGYYVRALARDLGRALDLPAHLVALRRTASGAFDEGRALPLERVDADALQPMAEAVAAAMPTAALTAEGARRAKHGQTLEHADFTAPPPDAPSAWLAPDGALVAVGERSGDRWSVLRGFRGSGDDATERGSG